jgi:hypothetical protein
MRIANVGGLVKLLVAGEAVDVEIDASAPKIQLTSRPSPIDETPLQG